MCISDMYYESLVLVKKVLIELGYKAVITRDRNENRYRLWINSMKFVNMLKRLGYKSNKKVPRTIKEYHMYSKCFIRGLYDAEGNIEFWKPRSINTYKFNFTNKSLSITLGMSTKS